MATLIDLTGKRFNRLVVSSHHSAHRGVHKWECRCDCGNTKIVFGSNLNAGYTQSCGCLQKERASIATKTHGGAGAGQRHHTAEYNCWRSVKTRCNGKDPRYGGRGITMCEEWRNSFSAFLRDMGRKPTPNHSIDRIDNNGDYSPDNCRWATRAEQAVNKRNNRWVQYKGKRRIMSHVAEEHGIDVGHFRKQLMRNGWDADKSVAHFTSE